MSRIKLKKQLEQSATPGSLPVTDASNELNFTAPGTNGQVLTVTAGIPTWENVAVNDAFNGTSVNGTSVQLGDDTSGVTPGVFTNNRFLNMANNDLRIDGTGTTWIGDVNDVIGYSPGGNTLFRVVEETGSHDGSFTQFYNIVNNPTVESAGTHLAADIYVEHKGEKAYETYGSFSGVGLMGITNPEKAGGSYSYVWLSGTSGTNIDRLRGFEGNVAFSNGSVTGSITQTDAIFGSIDTEAISSSTMLDASVYKGRVLNNGNHNIVNFAFVNFETYTGALPTGNKYSFKSPNVGFPIYNEGDVYIGVANGTDKLDVNGTARIRTSKGTQATTITGRDVNGAITNIILDSSLSLSAGVLSSSGGSSCPAPMTYAALQALVTSNSLIPGCTYTINDFVQGNLAAGTTVTLTAIDNNTLSMQAHVFTAYDDQAWFGIYDFVNNVLVELRDNLGNVVKGSLGVEVAAFYWGNTSITDTLIDNSTFIFSGTGAVSKVKIEKLSTVDLTNFTGDFAHSNIDETSVVGIINVGYLAFELNEITSFSQVIFNSTSLITFTSNTLEGGSTVNYGGTAANASFVRNKLFGTTYNKTSVSGDFIDNSITSGIVNHNGGNTYFLTKQLNGTLTTGNFNHTNIVFISPATKTLTAANTNRGDYVGVVSASPLI